MIKVNEYFDGKVKSLDVSLAGKKRTLGAMAAGEFEFDTTTKETMTIISGELAVYFPEDNEWEEFCEGCSFDVPANSKLKVKVTDTVGYLCEYE